MSESTATNDLREDTATVGFVDVVESVRLMQAAELAAIQRVRLLLDRAAVEVTRTPGGQVAERRGDGLVLTFADAASALRCVCRLHELAAAPTSFGSPAAPLQLRAGLHRTHLFADTGALYGAGVNLAARIAALGRPGDTLMSATVRDELLPPLDGLLEDLGECWLKHMDEPVRIFRHRAEHPRLPIDLEQAISARMKLKPTLVVRPAPSVWLAPGTDAAAIATDQLVRQLSRSPAMHVVSALSSRALRGRELSLQQLYTLMHADYVLEPVLHCAAEGGSTGPSTVRMTVALWRQGAADPVWDGCEQGSARDLLSTQSELIGRTVHAVSRCIVHVEQRAVTYARALPNLALHTLYLSAVDLLHRFAPADFHRAHALFEALRQRAPRQAEPLAWLARWHVFRVVQGWSDDSRRDGAQALHYSHQALDRDPQSALALTMAGSVQAGVVRNAPAAQALYKRALSVDPNDSLAWLMSSVAHGFMDAAQPALAASETALGLAPVDPMRHYYDALSATAALRAGEYERCIALAERAITANGSHGSAFRAMAIAQQMRGEEAAARQTVQRLLAVEPHFTVKNYLARVPPGEDKSRRFAQALQEAGLPAD